jgi:hypothetical protein
MGGLVYREPWEVTMKRWILVFALVLAVPLFGLPMSIHAESSAGETDWSVKASYFDACCCAPSCPCLFGSAPTLGFCEGLTLLEMDKANYGDVHLDGLNVVAVYRGGTWIKFYVDDSATAEQTDAMVKLLPTFEGFFAIENVLEVKNVPISVERGEGTIKVSTPNTSSHVEVMMGSNGKPIKVANLPWPTFPGPPFLDHTQYKTTILKHEGGEQNFEHTGTNSFTAKIDVSSAPEH